MKSFIVLFNGAEGTSPLMRLLNNFDQISIIHHVGNVKWEPFDNHNCGQMPLQSLLQCLELIFNKEPLDLKKVNRIYTKTATGPLDSINKNGSVGFKMRFHSPYNIKMPLWKRFERKIINRFNSSQNFKKSMFDLFRRNGVIIFIAVRQDALRWALSNCHGGAKPWRLQFMLARGEIRKEDIGKVYVDCEQLEKIIKRNEIKYSLKRRLMDELEQAGVEVHVLRYEDFLEDKVKYFQRICKILMITISEEKINSALSKGSFFEKVHSDQISEFVINHQDVIKRFGKCFYTFK